MVFSFELVVNPLVAALAQASGVVRSALVDAQGCLDGVAAVHVAEVAHEAGTVLQSQMCARVHLHQVLHDTLIVLQCLLLASDIRLILSIQELLQVHLLLLPHGQACRLGLNLLMCLLLILGPLLPLPIVGFPHEITVFQ